MLVVGETSTAVSICLSVITKPELGTTFFAPLLVKHQQRRGGGYVRQIAYSSTKGQATKENPLLLKCCKVRGRAYSRRPKALILS